MSSSARNLAATVHGMRPVVPAKDFDISKRFYIDLGFEPRELTERLFEMRLGAFRFLLQNYYVKDWAENFTGPIGLGFRVPMIIVSPFTRGGFVSSDLFDHTSVLRFLETLFGAEVPNLSAWRRATVGDMTPAFNFKAPDQSIPNLPSPVGAIAQTLSACVTSLTGTTSISVPNSQSLPTQESGAPTRPSGVC